MENLATYGYPGLFVATFLAATVIPFSSEIVLTTMLLGDFDPVWCVLIATVGNWLGGMSSYGLGFLGKWQWIEKWLRVPQAKVAATMQRWQRFGVWLALVTWFPVVGDLIAIGLGFIRAKLLPVAGLMLLGKFARFALLAWLFLLGKEWWLL